MVAVQAIPVAYRDGRSIAPMLILASGSLYRRQLLARLNIPFEVDAPSIDETPLRDEPAPETATRLALEKALSSARRNSNALIIGSDQVAELDGVSIGKPGSHEHALGQLQMLRGRTALFHTALCLVDSARYADGLPGADQRALVSVKVRFRNLADAELDTYLRIEQPYDCAGSAKAEGLGIALIEEIESRDPTALIGLPLIALVTMLRNVGYPLFATRC